MSMPSLYTDWPDLSTQGEFIQRNHTTGKSKSQAQD